MLGRTHQIIGVTAGLATYLLVFPYHYSPATFGAAMVTAHLTSLLPDIDQPASTFWHSLPMGTVAGKAINPFLQHRNLTHSFLGVGIVAILLHTLLIHFPSYWGIAQQQVFIVGMVAYGSHLLADMITVEGIPLFFPYKKMYGFPPSPFAGLRIETGHWFENLIIFPAVNIFLLTFIFLKWPIIHAIIFH